MNACTDWIEEINIQFQYTTLIICSFFAIEKEKKKGKEKAVMMQNK